MVEGEGMIEKCNFKTNVTDGTKGCRLTYENQFGNSRCVGEENCVLYQGYKNSALILKLLGDGK